MSTSTKSTSATNTTPRSVVQLHDVSKAYRRGIETIVAVDHVSIDITAGTFTSITGPSGSGKTTLLNLLIGWEHPDTGSRTPAKAPTTWSELAVVPQRLGLLEQCTIAENVSLPGRVAPLDIDPDELMRLLAIDHLATRFPYETSLGEQQRTAIGRALVCRPELLVTDEPTSHQDEVNTERITQLLTDAAAHGTAVVVATHDDRIGRHATHRYTLVDGHVR